jgi:oxygen-independent coproporphyrinogen III oxidase
LAGIYIHIPFCKQACHYCNFHFSTSLRYKNELIAALLKEIELSPKSSAEAIETIYFGGGTPSLCSQQEITSLLEKIHSQFALSQHAEITLEANPDDITVEKLAGWKQAGINRLSIGVQSFFEEDLRWMNRAHNAQQALYHLQLALQYFPNITIDLIYGSPGLTDEKWKQNVDTALQLGIPHISCYALTVEPKTPLQKLIQLQKTEDVDPDKQSAQFLLLMDWLHTAGFEHYEISNFAKPGFRSQHNSSYWKGKKYHGFGPSAHSFDGHNRWWNVANNNQYIEAICKGTIPLEKEELTPLQKINEYIMISLRTMEGLDMERLKNESWGLPAERIKNIAEELLQKSKSYISNGQLLIKDDHLLLTNEGKLLADGIAADLFPDQ